MLNDIISNDKSIKANIILLNSYLQNKINYLELYIMMVEELETEIQTIYIRIYHIPIYSSIIISPSDLFNCDNIDCISKKNLALLQSCHLSFQLELFQKD